MAKDTFTQLWQHHVSEQARNFTADLDIYQDTLHYLIALRRPHYASLAIPRIYKNALVLAFHKDHHIYLQEISPGSDYVHIIIYRPPPASSPPRPR